MSTTTQLVQQLQSSDIGGQVTAAESLAHLGAGAQPAIIALVQSCGSANEDLCNWCSAALEEVGPPAVEQIDELALLASSASSDVAFWAATMLGRAGALAMPAVSVLTERSQDGSMPEVQKRAAWALEKIQAA